MTYEIEILDRVRRIETKLSRFIAGEQDVPTKLTAEMWHPAGDLPEMEMNSMSVTLHEVLAVAHASDVAAGESFMLCENGSPRMLIKLLD